MKKKPDWIFVFQVKQAKVTYGNPYLPMPVFPQDYFPAWLVDSVDLEEAFAFTQVTDETKDHVKSGVIKMISSEARSTSVGDRLVCIKGNSFEMYQCEDFDWQRIFPSESGGHISDVARCILKWKNTQSEDFKRIQH